MLQRIIIILVSIFGTLLISFTDDFTLMELTSIALMIGVSLFFFRSIGRSYEILYIPLLLAIFQCLLMPVVVYHLYNDDFLVRALRYDMGVPTDDYFSFVLPAVVFMGLGMLLPVTQVQGRDQFIRSRISALKEYLQGKGNLGLLLMVMGGIGVFLQPFIGGNLGYLVYLVSKLIYVGTLYIFFSDFKSRKLYILISVLIILGQSLREGMFGELVYTVGLVGLLLVLGLHISFQKKFILIVAGIFFVLIIQSVKGDYRDYAWRGKESAQETKAGTFFSLIMDRVTNPQDFFNQKTFFPTINRFNQGMIIGKVFKHVPQNEPFAEGETIFLSLAASFVPRVMWPDKPISGGHYNMLRFTGFKIEGYSMNLSPIGEAYANFDRAWGLVFMFLYGLFFNLSIVAVLNIARRRPTILLWIPILYLNSVQIETDVLMCVNSLMKNCLFAWFIYWLGERVFKVKF